MDITTKIWYLAKFDIFKILGKKELKIMEKSMEIKVIKKNQKIHFPEKLEQYVYFLKKGALKVTSQNNENETAKHHLKPGNIFGELVVAQNNASDYNVAIAIEDCLLCFMSIDMLKLLIKENPDFNLSIHKFIGYRVQKIERKIDLLIFKNSKTRIIDFLIEVAKTYGTEKENSYLVKNFLSLNDIAKLTATTNKTVTDIINDLQTQNLISYSKSSIEISPSRLV